MVEKRWDMGCAWAINVNITSHSVQCEVAEKVVGKCALAEKFNAVCV